MRSKVRVWRVWHSFEDIEHCLHVDFTGISAPYEVPENPEIHIKTGEMDVADSVKLITDYLIEKNYI